MSHVVVEQPAVGQQRAPPPPALEPNRCSEGADGSQVFPGLGGNMWAHVLQQNNTWETTEESDSLPTEDMSDG